MPPDKPFKILIVDDIKPNVDILQNSLQETYTVKTALSGESALRSIQEDPPDLILLDILMPGMDGYEVCRQIKADQRFKHIPVIFITSLNEEDDETKGLELGAVDYITKPFKMPIVQARVKNHLQLKHYQDVLEKYSMLDDLTQIPNRRHFDTVFQQEWKRAQRNQYNIALIIADIDFFKMYNDAYGHDAGDRCLKLVARTIKENLKRPSDVVARWGGEEFACILPGTDLQNATLIGDRLRLQVSELGLAHNHSAIADHITISLGVSAIIPTPKISTEILFKAADQALYQAKNKGRNRVECEDIGELP